MTQAPQDIEFLNWYVGVLLTLVTLLGGFVILIAKEEYSKYKLKRELQDKEMQETKESLKDVLSSLDVMREKIILELSYLKESVKTIPKLQIQISKLEIDIVRVSEKMQSIQNALEKSELFGKIIKVGDKK
jgi:hypothetical protein